MPHVVGDSHDSPAGPDIARRIFSAQTDEVLTAVKIVAEAPGLQTDLKREVHHLESAECGGS
jgi:hypothetical protein